MFFPKTQEISDLILLEKAVRTIRRIVKDDPRERVILLKELKKNCNVEYKGDYKAFDAWLERREGELFEEIKEKIIEEQMSDEEKQNAGLYQHS